MDPEKVFKSRYDELKSRFNDMDKAEKDDFRKELAGLIHPSHGGLTVSQVGERYGLNPEWIGKVYDELEISPKLIEARPKKRLPKQENSTG